MNQIELRSYIDWYQIRSHELNIIKVSYGAMATKILPSKVNKILCTLATTMDPMKQCN